MKNINETDYSYVLNKVFVVKRSKDKKYETTLEVAKSIEQIIANDDERHSIESIKHIHVPLLYHRDKKSTFIVLRP